MDAATCVYTAVVTGTSAQDLRDLIEQCARAGYDPDDAEGIERRRRAAVNEPARSWRATLFGDGGRPLAAANRLRRGDLICVLVELGADVEPVFGPWATPVAVCVSCGSDPAAAASVRALLRRPGAEDARAPVRFNAKHWCSLAHYCVRPSLRLSTSGSPRLRCLEALVRDGGADINALDSDGLTPLAWLSDWIDGFLAPGSGDGAEGWPAALLALGADPNSCGEGRYGAPPALYWIKCVRPQRQGLLVCWLRALLEGGARFSGGVFDGRGHTPLTLAAWRGLVEVVRFLLEEARVDPNEPNRLTGALPLTCCARLAPVVAALLAGGADAGRADRFGRRPLLHALSPWEEWSDRPGTPGAALALVRAGASLAVRGPHGETPLLMAHACWPPDYLSDDRLRLLEELLRRTPEADRRATLASGCEAGSSAVDLIAGGCGAGWLLGMYYLELSYTTYDLDDNPDDDDLGGEVDMAAIEATVGRSIEAARRMVAELIVSGAPVREEHREAVEEWVEAYGPMIAARRAVRATRELAARRSESRRWRAHDCMVGLALEERDAREADERLAVTEARLAELERAVAEAGLGSDDEEQSEESEESDEESDEEAEAGEEQAAASGSAAAKEEDEKGREDG